MSDDNGKRTEISEKSKVSVGLLVLVGIPIVSWVIWLSVSVQTIKQRTMNSWTIQNQKLWADRLSWKNPSLGILPDIDTVIRDSKSQEEQ